MARRPGDRIALDQVFVEIETAKSLVELPSAFEGVVSELLVDEGNTVDVGTPILVIQTDAAGADAAASAPRRRGEAAARRGRRCWSPGSAHVASHAAAAVRGRRAVLVGHGILGPGGHASQAASARHGAHERSRSAGPPPRPRRQPAPRLRRRPPPTAGRRPAPTARARPGCR